MIEIAICDDLDSERNALKEIIEQYAKQYHVTVKLSEFCDGAHLVEAYSQNKCFDIIFLDIFMKDVNDMQAAQEIRKFDKDVPIVFLTTTSEFALDGYSVKAFDYILKSCEDKKDRIFSILSSDKFKALGHCFIHITGVSYSYKIKLRLIVR